MSGAQYNEIETRQQIKTFAHTLDATSYMLRALDFPLHKLRDVVDGLQGAAGGRTEFDLSHLALARRLRHTGADKTAETYTARKVGALNRAQHKAGRLLFTITRGGGIEHKRTHYVDHLTPAANWMMQQARASDLWKQNPGKAIEAFTDEAINLLPPAVAKGDATGAGPLSDDDYISLAESRLLAAAEKLYTRIASTGSSPVEEAHKLAKLLIARAAEIANYKAVAEFAELKQRATENGACSEVEAAGVPLAAVADGLQVCRPSVETPNKNDESMLAAALAYARAGIPVFPVRRDKSPLTGHGLKDATTDEQTVRAWWQRWPDAGIGVPTGRASGWLGIDSDPRHGGDAALSELIEQHGPLPATLEARTGGGGHHIIFAYPQGAEVRNSAGKVGEGLDVRGEGGYIVAAPSMHASGRRYEWRHLRAPAPVPEWLLALLTTEQGRAAPKRRAEGTQGAGTDAIVTEGNRNQTLFRIASAERGRGRDYADILQVLIEANARQCAPPLDLSELEKIARSVMRYAPNAAAVA